MEIVSMYSSMQDLVKENSMSNRVLSLEEAKVREYCVYEERGGDVYPVTTRGNDVKVGEHTGTWDDTDVELDGKGYRFWASWPTEEERDATPWNVINT
jgi:hypothetical protein